MSKIGIGIIGCGNRSRGVVRNVFKATDKVEVVALCDPHQPSIDLTQKDFGPDIRIFEDYRDLVADPQVKWVVIGSWNCFHRAHTVAAFEAGKHVFCEKPLATTPEDCLAMLKAWRASGKMFSISFTMRYSPHYMRIKELLDEGVIGDIISMEFNETLPFNHGGYIHGDWRRKTEWAGSHLLEKCCHDIDLVNWMVESRAKRVASFGGCDFFVPRNAPRVEQLGKNKEGKKAFHTFFKETPYVNPFNNDKDIVDNQVAIIEYENGVRATFHANCMAAEGMEERRMYICGTEGTLRADVIPGKIEISPMGFDTKVQDVSTSSKGGHGGGDPILGQSLVESILHGTPPRTGLNDGLKSAFTAFAIDEAMETGTVVDVGKYWKMADACGMSS